MNKQTGIDFITMMDEWFSKAPALPTNAKELIVKYAPIISLVFGILGVLMSISGAGLLSLVSPMAALGGAESLSSVGSGLISTLFWLASSVLMILAYQGLKTRSKKGWTLVFWSEVINVVSAVVSLSFLSGLLGALIGFYLLFQIKSYYK